jgi:hypothetical protein
MKILSRSAFTAGEPNRLLIEKNAAVQAINTSNTAATWPVRDFKSAVRTVIFYLNQTRSRSPSLYSSAPLPKERS